jgi:26S proteasome regulatory subunit N7
MALSFGITPEFLDKELSNFIYAGKLTCKIDKVQGVIESSRHNKK